MPHINGQEVGPIGYGLMGLTWRQQPPSEEQAFSAMRAALAAGCNFWNGGEFYGPPERNSLVLLNRYFAKYPEDANKVVLSIKGGANINTLQPDGSPEGIRRSVDACLEQLPPRVKKIDVFECARRDANVPLEETFGVLKDYVDKGLIGAISLSEVSAATIHEAVKHIEVAACEVELSLWATDVLSNGVAAACAQYGIPLVAYSPVGRGMLTGRFKSADDVPVEMRLLKMERFEPGNFEVNLRLVEQVEKLAEKKGCTPAQLAIGWTMALSKRTGMPVVVPIPGSTTVARVEENAKEVELTETEMEEIDETLSKFEIRGHRYYKGALIET